MPELPEVETIRRGLRYECLGKTITKATINNFDYAEIPPEILKDRTIKDVKRYGKNIFIQLDNNYGLKVHLGMSGRILVLRDDSEPPKHSHLILNMDDDARIFFIDPRRFGSVSYIENGRWQDFIFRLGPEPWDITTKNLYEVFQKRRITVWEALMDQSIISGIGNIYANEICHLAKISPLQKTKELSEFEVELILLSARFILEEAIKNQGTSFDTFYTNVYGEFGSAQKYLRIYKQEGKVCNDCKDTIKRQLFKGRSIYLCSCYPGEGVP